jgi:hypothetical protein
VEVAGAYFLAKTEIAINVSSYTVITTATTAYLQLVPSGSAGSQIISASWTATAPVWRTDMQGWYASAASTTRVVAGVYKVSNTQQSGKYLLNQSQTVLDHGADYLSGATLSDSKELGQYSTLIPTVYAVYMYGTCQRGTTSSSAFIDITSEAGAPTPNSSSYFVVAEDNSTSQTCVVKLSSNSKTNIIGSGTLINVTGNKLQVKAISGDVAYSVRQIGW